MKTKNSVRKQRHRSAAEWHRLVSAWKASGKTRRVWCREQGLSVGIPEALDEAIPWHKEHGFSRGDHSSDRSCLSRSRDRHPNHPRRRRGALRPHRRGALADRAARGEGVRPCFLNGRRSWNFVRPVVHRLEEADKRSGGVGADRYGRRSALGTSVRVQQSGPTAAEGAVLGQERVLSVAETP